MSFRQATNQVNVAPNQSYPAALASSGAPMEMAGRTMKGHVTANASCLAPAYLAMLLALAKSYIQTLPAKKPNCSRQPRD